MFKDATLSFSHSASKKDDKRQNVILNLAAVIPAMDHIDGVLTSNAINNRYCLAIQVALTIGKKTLNHYYSKTDLSNIYWIAMGMSYHLFHKPLLT